MSRYVKYDTALRYIKDASMRLGGVWGIEAAAHFEHEPTIEICFCGECEKWHNGWCYKHGRAFEPNGFCSYGERSEP